MLGAMIAVAFLPYLLFMVFVFTLTGGSILVRAPVVDAEFRFPPKATAFNVVVGGEKERLWFERTLGGVGRSRPAACLMMRYVGNYAGFGGILYHCRY
jgi:hypothetical protein